MADPLFDVSGRAVLVAGGARGLGAVLAEALARRGATILVGDLDGAAAAPVTTDVPSTCAMKTLAGPP